MHNFCSCCSKASCYIGINVDKHVFNWADHFMLPVYEVMIEVLIIQTVRSHDLRCMRKPGNEVFRSVYMYTTVR